MFVVIVQFDSKTEHRRALIDALVEYGHEVRQNEPGTLRFEIIQERHNPNRFFLYEVYRDREGFAAHSQRPDFGQRWEKMKDWLAGPLTQLATGTNIFPPDDAGWLPPAKDEG
jgi:autoinducer 2-degrading protein